jgi:hypothetical protein
MPEIFISVNAETASKVLQSLSAELGTLSGQTFPLAPSPTNPQIAHQTDLSPFYPSIYTSNRTL